MKKILLVEDDPFISDIYSRYFLQEGYSVDFANSESKALEKIQNNYPDLLILDLNLDANNPGPQDGLNILKKIRHNSRAKNLKVIVVSNYNEKKYPEINNLDRFGVIKIFLKIQHSPIEVVKYAKETLNKN